MEKYQIRNVAEREIYDSYMGIMRISPNPVSDSNDKLVDDPTSHLNSILSGNKVDIASLGFYTEQALISEYQRNYLIN